MLSTFVSVQLSMLGLMILSLNTAVGMAGIFPVAAQCYVWTLLSKSL